MQPGWVQSFPSAVLQRAPRAWRSRTRLFPGRLLPSKSREKTFQKRFAPSQPAGVVQGRKF